MKKIISLIVGISVLLSTEVFAFEFPHYFWAINEKYTEAEASQNYADIITYGNQEIELMKSISEVQEKKNILTSRYKSVGLAYEALGDYENSARAFQGLYDYTNQYRTEYYDYNVSAKARAAQFTSQLRMFTEGGTPKYFGAKNEISNGVLFGVCANGETRKMLSNESLVLVYQELGYSLVSENNKYFEEVAAKGQAIEYALNCPNEGEDIANIHRFESNLQEISGVFSSFPNTKFFLRFGAEFDVWTNPVAPDAFINAFKYVSNYFKSRNPNVAIVWSPNQTSRWNENVLDYYPGDEYVDWVGMSLYAEKYFQTDDEESSIYFKIGDNSDPVIAVRNLIELFGDRKPIMISESGCSHRYFSRGEDATAFAVKRLREYMYYLPMVYPQIKAIAYFDWYVNQAYEDKDFRLSTNKTLQNEYIKITKGARYVQDNCSNSSPVSYREITDGITVNSIFPISTYVHKYKAEPTKVAYFIDDNCIDASSEVPYTCFINASAFASGYHTLKSVVSFQDGTQMTQTKSIIINNTASNISVKVSGKNIEFDQTPVIYNDRTLVPMRKIFEELGATVGWDEETKTATANKGNTTISVTNGSIIMNVNGKNVYLDCTPIILAGRTLVPARAIAEGMGCKVDWDGNTRTVIITE